MNNSRTTLFIIVWHSVILSIKSTVRLDFLLRMLTLWVNLTRYHLSFLSRRSVNNIECVIRLIRNLSQISILYSSNFHWNHQFRTDDESDTHIVDSPNQSDFSVIACWMLEARARFILWWVWVRFCKNSPLHCVHSIHNQKESSVEKLIAEYSQTISVLPQLRPKMGTRTFRQPLVHNFVWDIHSIVIPISNNIVTFMLSSRLVCHFISEFRWFRQQMLPHSL